MIDLIKLGWGEIRLMGERSFTKATAPVFLPIQKDGTFEGEIFLLGEEYKIVITKAHK